jgi:hypothetical protein
MPRRFGIALGALVLLFGMTASAAAAPGGTDRPFRATASGQITWSANALNCAAGFTEFIDAAGQATHLGSFTLAAKHCEVFTGPGTGNSIQGQMTLTAANGDRLYGTYATAWVFSNGKVSVTGWLNVFGGTGRFTNATGTLWQNHVVSVVSEAPPWPVAMTFEGRLSY